MSEKFILKHTRSPGDIMCLSALVRDIALTYGDKYQLDTMTTVAPLWENNPYLTKLWNHDMKHPVITARKARIISCDYGKGLKEQNRRTVHFVGYFHKDFETKTGIHVPLHYPHGDLHLSEYEKNNPPVNGRYWLMITGGKSDFPIKVWHRDYFQEVCDEIGRMGLGVVQTGANFKGHWHPKLKGDHVVDLVGWGKFREFIMQIYHADGVICGITAAMHIAAALHKPCVVLGGGREAWWWEAYVRENKGLDCINGPHPVPHRYLHTIGQLDCCAHHGCWRDVVVKTHKKRNACKYPELTDTIQPVARCFYNIKPAHVLNAVRSYYYDGTLTPPEGTALAQELADLHNSKEAADAVHRQQLPADSA